MICIPCRNTQHALCISIRRTFPENEVYVENTWCDCQHVTSGVNINRELVPKLSDE